MPAFKTFNLWARTIEIGDIETHSKYVYNFE